MTSPVGEVVKGMTAKEVQRRMVELFGDGDYTTWDDAMRVAEDTKLFNHTRKLGKTRTDQWSVKVQFTKEIIAADVSGPLAVSKAVLTIAMGKGNSYGEAASYSA